MSSEKTQIAKLSLDEKVQLFKRRFVCRQDAFYTKRTWETFETDPNTNEKIKIQKNTFRVQCANDGDTNLCLIAQNKGKCFQCTNKVRTVLDDSWCRKHINGTETLCLVPITPDGSKFGAIDFDRSIEEGLQYVFEDAKSVRDFAATKGIHSYIARSSNKGYHLYFFFDNWVDPVELQSFLCYLLAQTGFVTRQTTHSLPLPEMFPKQFEFRSDTDGSGIRVPFSEPDVRKGRNCLVDDKMQAYPLDQQWDLLSKAIENSTVVFQQLLIDEKVVIHSGGVGTSGPRKKKQYRKKADGTTEETEDSPKNSNEKPVQRGSFWNVVAACPALQEYWTRKDGQYVWDTSNPKGLFNSARVASMNIALASLDGEEIIKKRWPTPQTERQIDGAKHLGYKPCTCHWMQMQGVCHVGKHPKLGSHCFQKLPPLGVVEGKLVENPENLPESEWDSPSPVRHITDKNLSFDEVKERIGMLAISMKNQAKKDAGESVPVALDEKGRPIIKETFVPDNPAEMLDGLMKKVMLLKNKERELLTQHVLANKWFTKTDWNNRIKNAGGEIGEEKKDNVAKTYKNFMFKSKNYYLKDGIIFCMHTDAKGNVHEEMVWNFWIERTAEPATVKLIEEEGVEKVIYDDRSYNLIIHVGGQIKTIEVSNKVYANSGSFFEAVRRAGGTELKGPMSSKEDYDVHMAAISYFSEMVPERHALKDIGYYNMKGGMKYIMPSVIVTQDEIVKNDAYLVKMESDYAKPLDFQIFDTHRFKEVARHIVTDLFNCNNRMMVMSTFAHAMASVCTKPLEEAKGWRKSPILWVCGDFGDGKTFVFEHIQYFFGNFSKSGPSGAGGSYVAKIGAANTYRHTILMLEDYKADLEKDGGISMKKFIQHAYDRVGNPALKRDGTMRSETPRARGLIAISGEDVIEREASALSRLVVVDGKYGGNIQEGGKVQKMKHLYSGFTPYVVKTMLQMNAESITKLWTDCFNAMMEGIKREKLKFGPNRICENYALNLFGMRIALDTMVFYGAVSREEAETITQEHIGHLRKMRDHQLDMIESARGSTSFVDDLRNLLADPSRYHITGWPGLEGVDAFKNSKSLGFYSSKNPEVIFLNMGLAHAAVAESANRLRASVKNRNHIVRQLLDDGVIIKSLCDSGRNYCRRQSPLKQTIIVTPVKAEELGFGSLTVVPTAGQSNKPVQNYRDEDVFALE